MSQHATYFSTEDPDVPLADTYCCPCCYYTTTERQRIYYHLKNHLNLAVRHQGYLICKCSRRCRDASHFHCPNCQKTVIRKIQFLPHLKSCKETPAPRPSAAPPPLAPAVASAAPPPLAPAVASAAPPPLAPTVASAAPPPRAPAVASAAPPPRAPAVASAAPPPLAPTVASAAPPPRALAAPAPRAPTVASATPPRAPPRVWGQKQQTVQCIHCGLTLNRRNLRIHIRRKHSDNKRDITAQCHLSSQCIDPEHGVFVVVKSFTGPSTPIHAIKKTVGKDRQMRCEMDKCKVNADSAEGSNLFPFECHHLQSLAYCPPARTENPTLEEDVLMQMVQQMWFGEARKQKCLQRQAEAMNVGVPLSCLVTIGGPPTKKFLSVYEPDISHYSRLGRVLVTYDSKRTEWCCPCAKPRRSCIHKTIGMWHLFQIDPPLFVSFEDEVTLGTFPDVAEVEEEQHIEGAQYPPDDPVLSRMVHYIFRKKIPADLPHDVISAMGDFPRHLIPHETICTECTGQKLLSEPQLITASAKIVTLTDIIEGVSTYCKYCCSCGMIFRYQEWSDGIHNFDDHTLVSLHLCVFLRNTLQTHQAIESAVEVLEKTCGKRFPTKQKILYAYLHYEAMTGHSYTFSCVTCGHHPVTVVMDLHKQGVFSMPISSIEPPPPEYDGKVNVEDFWESVSLEMVSRGLVPSNKQNPFLVRPSYHYWAPWIGPHTRGSSLVSNTEHCKIRTPRNPNEESDLLITADRLTDEILKLKMEAVRSLCKECGVDSKGSRMDLIMKLRKEMQNRSTYDKVFAKVWGASGGWAVVTCPCAVVYGVKFNLRAESPRDFADLLLSMKHFPNVTLYDFARGLATHTNRREPQSLPFSPHEGRLLDPTDDSIRLASAEKVKVSLPWLTTKKAVPDENGHPVTGSSEHYALYDRFHEANTKDPKDVLRKMELVPELRGWAKSQHEQLFSGMRKNDHFLNTMSPSSHVFLMRNILHHYNNGCNDKTIENIKETLGLSAAIAQWVEPVD